MSKKYLSPAETAQLVRKALKEAFGKVKFSVRSDRSSIRISWTDGPNAAQVEAVTDKFKGGYFDGSIDYQGSIKHMMDGVEVSLGTDFVFTTRTYSDEAISRAIERVYSKLRGNFVRDGIDKPTVEQYRGGKLYPVQLTGLHFDGMQSVQHEIMKTLNKHSDRLKVNHSPTAARLMVIGDDAYSRTHGSGFSAVPLEVGEGSPAEVLANALIDRVRQ